MSNPVVTHQPGSGGYGTNVQTGEWSTGLCSCFSDLFVCAVGCLCPLALSCYTASKYGENCFLGCLPGGMTAIRTHMRLTYGIQGTIINDALMTFCCGLCETCRMAREVRIRNGDVWASRRSWNQLRVRGTGGVGDTQLIQSPLPLDTLKSFSTFLMKNMVIFCFIGNLEINLVSMHCYVLLFMCSTTVVLK